MIDAQADLDAYLDAYLDAEDATPNVDEPAPPPWIADVIDAERRLSRLRRLAREKAEVQDVAAAEVGHILAWKDDRVAGIEALEALETEVLEAWHRARFLAGMIRGKSVKLASGTLKLRAPGVPKLLVDADEDELATDFRQSRPTWTREKVTLDKNVIKQDTVPGDDGKVIDKATGEVVPGLRYEVTTEDSFSLEVAP